MNRYGRAHRCVPIIIVAVCAIAVSQPCGAQLNKDVRPTKVPPWDHRGHGPLKWQGVSCLDVSDDAGFVAVGTIAPPGDPNVFLIDRQGRIAWQHAVGQRWIERVALDPRAEAVYVVCTMPEGRPGERPVVFRVNRTGATRVFTTATGPPRLGVIEHGDHFHYGEHSNHIAPLIDASGTHLVGLERSGVRWLGPKTTANAVRFPRPSDGLNVSMALGRNGMLIVGRTAAQSEPMHRETLFVFEPKSRQPAWSREIPKQLDPAPAWAPGKYGSPTLPDGTRRALPQRDARIAAPLSVAAFDPTDDPSKRLVAAADYEGWMRTVTSSATGKDELYGMKFPPTRPTVSVYDSSGDLVRRFDAAKFRRPFWCDLAFTDDGAYLLASPHNWSCRGLAGQSMLPADGEADSVYLLDVSSGDVREVLFPDAVADLTTSAAGRIVAACWDGRVYSWRNARQLLGARRKQPDIAKAEIRRNLMAEWSHHLGGPARVRVSRDGSRIVVAGADGILRALDADGRPAWELDLNKAAKRGDKPWLARTRTRQVVPGVWQLPTGRTESDFGSQILIQAPDGLILIEGHAGLSLELEWAAIESLGLNPGNVRYVLATHEHGDHAPGAYLWRVRTGARFVCSDEMAYVLQHHLPAGTGYGFHPPVPTDIRIKEDKTLDLAGLKVAALRLPGHTAGSMGWMFEKDGRRIVSTGDLIMPDGALGFSQSVNFSARDILSSLRNLDALRPDVVLPGHGGYGKPSRYIGAGILAGMATGWGRMPPERPDPRYGVSHPSTMVVGWGVGATSADFADINNDGTPDIAVVSPDGSGSTVRLYLNRRGKFGRQPDAVLRVPGVNLPSRLRLRHVNRDKTADLFVSGPRDAAVLMSQNGKLDYRTTLLKTRLREIRELRIGDPPSGGEARLLLGQRIGGFHEYLPGDRSGSRPMTPLISQPYCDVVLQDVNGDGRGDVIGSYGQLWLRQPDDRLAEAAVALRKADPRTWTFVSAGDFNADGKVDLAFLISKRPAARVEFFANTGRRDRPFRQQPDATLDLYATVDGRRTGVVPIRDGPTTADWDGDGVTDLIVGVSQQPMAMVIAGHRKTGLSADKLTMVSLDARLHFETSPFAADFNRDGRPDLASFAYTNAGPGGRGPLAVYIRLQDAR